MAQLAHIVVGDAPVDLTVGLAGCYVAQARPAAGDTYRGDEFGPPGVLYASAAAAPTDPLDWFEARGNTFFTFSASPAIPATWCKSAAAGATVSVALARAGDA